MSKQIQEQIASGKARLVAAPGPDGVPAPELRLPNAPRPQVESDRNFEIPTAFYGATAALYLAFLAVMFAGLATPGLVIPMAIFTIFVIAMFGVPAIWTRLRDNESAPMTVGAFRNAGIMTHTGRLSARDAGVQMLILPVLIVGWGMAAVTIAAIVS
ncbi:hypothetical protein [Erythrobacter sp.]|jgi:hypothetical protein|uniref:hypothetical protein n=1 Tax=Erythrobacter sp. TaxID=1042 RepID=UPI002E9850F3|nr:hypothetical protein [Erythrobacter sp.]